MGKTIFTEKRFNTVIKTIPADSTGTGFKREGVYYSFSREQSGIYKGKPYTKPPHILINTGKNRFRVEHKEKVLKFFYDPDGGFNFLQITDQDTMLELADYLVKLEGFLDPVSAQKQATRSGVKSESLQAFLHTFLQWCDKNKREEVEAAVVEALTDPDLYMEKNKGQLTRRGITQPVRNLHVTAFVDALKQVGAGVEFDWRAGYETVFSEVSRLAKHFNINILQDFNAGSQQVPEILQEMGKHLAAQGYALIQINIESDSYVMCIVPEGDYTRSISPAHKAGIRMNRL